MSTATCELRTRHRYPLHFEVNYRVFGKGHAVVSGAATTLNFSSHGILLTATEGVSKGQVMSLSVRWHSGASGMPKVELEIIGRVVRVSAQGTAVQILRYGFNPHAAKAAVGAPAF
jgi:hypothetical protein